MQTSCWLWKGSVGKDGYGLIAIPGLSRGAHRMVYEALVGKVPKGMQLDHLCRKRSCVNPTHLEVVTQRENCLRGNAPSAQRARQVRCIRGHDLIWTINKKGKPRRLCQTCKRNARRRYVLRQKAKAA